MRDYGGRQGVPFWIDPSLLDLWEVLTALRYLFEQRLILTSLRMFLIPVDFIVYKEYY